MSWTLIIPTPHPSPCWAAETSPRISPGREESEYGRQQRFDTCRRHVSGSPTGRACPDFRLDMAAELIHIAELIHSSELIRITKLINTSDLINVIEATKPGVINPSGK
jgi:hypothetical protein